MNYSYLMGIKDISELRRKGFNIEEIDGDYGITFEKDKEEEYEEFVKKNLSPGYWNEYLGENFVFIFKYPDNTIRRFVYDSKNEAEILNLCCEFAECKFPSFHQMLEDNSFYAEKYFNKRNI